MQHRINSSALVGLLEQWERGLTVPAERLDVADRLGQWLGALDAVQLNASLHAIELHAPASDASAADAVALQDYYEHTRAELLALIHPQQTAPQAPKRQTLRSLPLQTTVAEIEAPTFAPHHKQYQFVQRQLATKVTALRAQLRQRLARGNTQQQKLAALDGVLEKMLGEREQKLWTGLGVFLERRWKQGPVGQPFEREVQSLLSAELQARLQPVQGLVQAAYLKN